MKDKGKSQNHGGDSSVPRGYKKTEVGVIPEDWEIRTIGGSMQLINGRAFKPEEWHDNGLPIIRIQNLNDPESAFNFFPGQIEERHIVEKGDILFAWSGTKGTSFGARVWSGPTGVLNQHIFKVIPNKSHLTPHYAFLILRKVQENIEKQAHGFKASFVHIKKSDLVGVQLPVPPTKAEQEAIAGALSDADALIESLEQLIAKKRHIKQGAMQELLTGKKCLPGFQVKPGYKKTEVGVIPEDWDTPELGEILKSMQLGGNYKNTERENSWPLIKMGNLGRGSIKLDKLEFIDSSQAPASRDRLYADDLLFNTRNTLDLVGKIAVWRNELPEAYFNSNIARMKFKEECVSSYRFMNYIMNTPRTLKGLRSIAIGTTSVAAIYGRDLVKLKVSLPTKAEQEAIATILSDMDAEITALETKLAKTQAIKQGMMHNLLTGKIRLVESGKLRMESEKTTVENAELRVESEKTAVENAELRVES